MILVLLSLGEVQGVQKMEDSLFFSLGISGYRLILCFSPFAFTKGCPPEV